MQYFIEHEGELHGFGDLTLAEYASDDRGFYLKIVCGTYRARYQDQLATTIWAALKEYAAHDESLLKIGDEGVIINVCNTHHVRFVETTDPTRGNEPSGYKLFIDGALVFTDDKAQSVWYELQVVARGD